MDRWSSRLRRKAAVVLGAGGMLFAAAGGCQFDQIPVASSVDSREVIIGLIRGALVNPFDAFITNGINEIFDQFED